VVQVHDYGVEDGTPYLVMELLEGEDLGARLKRLGRLPLPDAAALALQVAQALRSAHEAGIIHRDLKPANIFLERHPGEEVVKVLDFGLAKAPKSRTLGDATKTGTLLGTPHYMSPEQARGMKELDHRTDLWSLAVILFRVITGRLPFLGDEIAAVLVAICADPIPVPSQVAPDLGPEVDRFFERALAREPGQRFQSAQELAEAFAAVAAGPGARRSSAASFAAAATPYPALGGAGPSAPSSGAATPPGAAMPYPTPSATPPTPHSGSPQGRGLLVFLGAAGVALSLGIVVLIATVIVDPDGGTTTKRPAPPPSPVPTPPPTPPAPPPAPASADACKQGPCCAGVACDPANQDAGGSICATRPDRCGVCPSGRACVAGPCRERLSPGAWQLRLARLDPEPPPTSMVCARRTGSGEPPVCTLARDAAERPGVDPSRGMVTRLRVTTADLLRGVDIEILDGDRPLASRAAAAHEMGIKRSALCLGLDFQLPGARITFYLDDP
jgi:serine/threonine-protein kinase